MHGPGHEDVAQLPSRSGRAGKKNAGQRKQQNGPAPDRQRNVRIPAGAGKDGKEPEQQDGEERQSPGRNAVSGLRLCARRGSNGMRGGSHSFAPLLRYT